MKHYIPMNRIEFVVGDLYNRNSVNDRDGFYLTEDKSLMYQSIKNGDYSILLGGNWRFELIADSSTGLCVKFQSFLDELKVSRKPLVIPESKSREVFIKRDEKLYSGEGCHYHPFLDNVYWDASKSILCIGDPDASGEVIEFAPQIYMVVDSGQAVCFYLKLSKVIGVDFI